ncbi:hypothetical protein ABPG75_010653 [Micractinium tetrahymenae]
MAATGPAAARWPALGLLDLPEGVLLRCLSLLSQQERLTSVCLVCKHLLALCTAPELLRQADAVLSSPQAAEALAGFLARHGEHVRVLRFDAYDWTPELTARMAAAVAGCLMAPRHLARLDFTLEGSLPLPGFWLGSHQQRLQGLSMVKLGAELEITTALGQRAALTALSLSAAPLRFSPGARLPPSL